MIFVALAMFSKEQGITVVGVCAVYEIIFVQNINIVKLFKIPSLFNDQSSRNNNHHSSKYAKSKATTTTATNWGLILRSAALVLTCSGLLLVRFYVMGSTLPVFTSFDNPASYSEAPTKQLTWSYLVAINSWLLLAPSDLCCDWTMGTVPLIEGISDLRNLCTIVTFSVLTLLGLKGLFASEGLSKKNSKVIVFSLALLALPFLPACNLFFPVGFVVAERVLYLPSMGFCLLISHGFFLMYKHHAKTSQVKTFFKCSLLLLLATHAAKTLMRNFDWKDESTIFLSGLKVNSGNAKLFNNVGHALEGKEEYGKALDYFVMATRVQPDDIGAHINVGRTLNTLKRFDEAENAYVLAKSLLPQAKPGKKYTARVAPQHLSVFLNLANLISKDPSRLEEADSLYRQAISMRSDYIQAYINRGDVLLRLNRSEEAQATYEQALTIESSNPDLYYNLGVVHIERGHPQQALAHFDRAIQLDPNHVQALMNSAILIQESGSAELRPIAYDRLFRADELAPDNDRVFFNLGMLGMDDNDYESAEKWFKRAVELKPDFRSALFNLALLLNERERPLEAIPHLRSLLYHHVDHVKGLVLLGDIYTNHVKDFDEAERCYKRIVAVDPAHVQARHNLCVVMVEKGDLVGAKSCLEHVQVLAPELDYVGKHLAIVQGRIDKQQQQQEQQQQQQEEASNKEEL